MFRSSASEVQSGGTACFDVSNVDGGFMTGVSGELYFETNGRYYVVAFSHPYSGSVKLKVKASR